MTIGWPSEQTSSVASVVKSLRLQLPPLLVDPIAKRPVERAQQRHPRPLAAGDLVELLLHPRGERDVDVVAEVLDQQVRHDLGDRLGMEPPLLDPDVAAIDDRRDRRRVGRRPADPVLLERLDQGRLGEARRRLGEMLGRRDLDHARAIAGRERSAAGPVSSSSATPSSRPSV